MNFSKILNRGKKAYRTISEKSEWGKCEECGARKLLFPFKDKEGEVWMLCEMCVNEFVKEIE